MPWAEALYACDVWWWDHYKGCPDYMGEKWSTHEKRTNEKLEIGRKYGVRLVQGSNARGFSLDSSIIHYGLNSGFQTINLAIHMGGNPIVLVGFDMKTCEKRHFFGPHPGRQKGVKYEHYISRFDEAAEMLPEGIEIINCTEKSALKCFPGRSLEDVLSDA